VGKKRQKRKKEGKEDWDYNFHSVASHHIQQLLKSDCWMDYNLITAAFQFYLKVCYPAVLVLNSL
jgi:hypothetical protein